MNSPNDPINHQDIQTSLVGISEELDLIIQELNELKWRIRQNKK